MYQRVQTSKDRFDICLKEKSLVDDHDVQDFGKLIHFVSPIDLPKKTKTIVSQ